MNITEIKIKRIFRFIEHELEELYPSEQQNILANIIMKSEKQLNGINLFKPYRDLSYKVTPITGVRVVLNSHCKKIAKRLSGKAIAKRVDKIKGVLDGHR